MDPPSLVCKGDLAEAWPFPQVADDTGGVLWLRPGAARMVPLGRGLGSVAAVAGSVEESTVTEQSGGRKRRDLGAPGAVGSSDDSSKVVSTCSGDGMMESDAKRLKASGSRDDNNESKGDVEASSGISNKLTDQVVQHSVAPKQDYIHVRARRGQATDSHSLAERARREKISERMKILQDLVPGCSKVIGKAMVLDEIINYIQSLQHQVEFLSMKLEALNSPMNPSVEGFPGKNFGTQAFDSTSGSTFTSQMREYGQGSSQEWLHMHVRGGFEKTA